MLKVLIALVFGIILVATSIASAQEADLRQITCRDFASFPIEQRAVILAFLAGYYASRSEPPIINRDRMINKATAMDAYCGTHRQESIVIAAESVMQAK